MLCFCLCFWKIKVSFIYVCISGNSECVKLLISMGACLEAYDLYYGTPLHVACANEHTHCVKELLNAGEGLYRRMNKTEYNVI